MFSFSQTSLPSTLPHNIQQGSPYYTVGPCWLSINTFFYFNLAVFPYLKLISCRQYIVGSCFSIKSNNLYLLTGVFRALIFNTYCYNLD